MTCFRPDLTDLERFLWEARPGEKQMITRDLRSTGPRLAVVANRRALSVAMRISTLILCVLSATVRADEVVWHSGFENGFPGGEWLDWDSGAYSAGGAMPAGRASAWTIVERQSGEPVFAGKRAYKGWIVGAATDSHRASRPCTSTSGRRL